MSKRRVSRIWDMIRKKARIIGGPHGDSSSPFQRGDGTIHRHEPDSDTDEALLHRLPGDPTTDAPPPTD
jgi:hypothetical protein